MSALNGFRPRDFRRGLRRAGLTPTEYRVAVELCEYAGPDKAVVWPSNPTLAEDCGLCVRTVVRALNRLQAEGVIACAGTRKGGRGRGTRWELLIKGDTPGLRPPRWCMSRA